MKKLNVTLLIVGSGPLKEKIKRFFKERGCLDKVVFLGAIPYEQMKKYYNLADIFCLPSRFTKYWQEQFGFVFAEAMSCAKPIVSTRIGAIPEVVADAGLLVSPGNFLELESALETLILDENLRKLLGERGRRRAIKLFSINSAAIGRDKVYRKVLRDLK